MIRVIEISKIAHMYKYRRNIYRELTEVNHEQDYRY